MHQENLGVGVLHPGIEVDLARVNIKLFRVERRPMVRVRGLNSMKHLRKSLNQNRSRLVIAYQVHNPGGATAD